MTRLPRLVLAVAVCLPAALPASAAAATPRYPSIDKVSPLKLGVGDTMVVRGKNFRSGTGRNTVVFKRDGGRAVFVKAGVSTRTRLSVKIPAKLVAALTRKAGKPVPTRLRVRVLAGRFGRSFTSVKGSPVIGPETVPQAGSATPAPGVAPAAKSVPAVGSTAGPASPVADAPPQDCDGDGITNDVEVDDDDDLLSDTLEATLKTDACKADTDGDGVGDGYEYYSAKDLNDDALPFPAKQPYPNALDKDDAGIDHDGDGLTLRNEFRAWRFTGARMPLSYSDGNQDTDGDSTIDAFEDVDGDLATNYAEVAGPLSGRAFWTAWVKDNNLGCPGGERYVESTYPGPQFQGLSFVDADSDGDGRLDGVDDIDHDGLTNLQESEYVYPADDPNPKLRGRSFPRRLDWCSVYVSVGPGLANNPPGELTPGVDQPGADRYARTDPFNPCKPVYSSACHKFVPLNYYVKTQEYVEDWAGAEPNR